MRRGRRRLIPFLCLVDVGKEIGELHRARLAEEAVSPTNGHASEALFAHQMRALVSPSLLRIPFSWLGAAWAHQSRSCYHCLSYTYYGLYIRPPTDVVGLRGADRRHVFCRIGDPVD